MPQAPLARDRIRGHLQRGLEVLGYYHMHIAHLANGEDRLFTAR